MIEAGGIDAVTITTPPETRRELVLEAIDAELHVIADKPFAPTAQGGRELDAAAKAKGVVLDVFHDRRLDADIRTLRKVIANGRLGRLWRVHSCMDFDDPATLEAGSSGWSSARPRQPPRRSDAVAPRPCDVGGRATRRRGPVRGPDRRGLHGDAPHQGGARSHISASKLNRLTARELRACGEAGSYVSSGTDVQAQAIFSGHRPANDPAGWGL